MAGGSVFSGIFKRPFDVTESRSRQGILITLGGGLLVVFLVGNPFQGLIWSQIILSIQLPWTVFPLIFLTSSRKVMGQYATPILERILLWVVAAVISILNILLLRQILSVYF
jgi:manganese transport protein